jgi:hypothetical protein
MMAEHSSFPRRYLEECLPKSESWDVPVEQQTEGTAAGRILEFLAGVGVGGEVGRLA